jgi:phosphatidate phosphatase PAH1
MKVGEGGEAFFVFETSEAIPQDLQTSPVVSPAISPQAQATGESPSIALLEPEPLDLTKEGDISGTGQEFSHFINRPKSADGIYPIYLELCLDAKLGNSHIRHP